MLLDPTLVQEAQHVRVAGMNLVICPETNVCFVTRLLPHGEALRYPLPSGRVDLERFQRRHCGGVPLT